MPQTHLDMDGIARADISSVRKGLVIAGELLEMVRRGASCGVECDDIQRDAEAGFEFLRKINDMYGPQFPTKG